MSKFYSISGVTHGASGGTSNGRRATSAEERALHEHYERHGGALPDNPLAGEFYKSRRDTSHTTTGWTPGDKEQFGETVCEVLHVEHDPHTGTVEQVVRQSVHGQSGTVKQKWEPDGPRGLRLTEQKSTHDDYPLPSPPTAPV